MSGSPGVDHTSRVYRSPLAFRTDHPDFASAAREYLRSRPELRGLRFFAASVGMASKATGGGVASITVELESPDRLLWLEVSRRPYGRWHVEPVIDRERWP